MEALLGAAKAALSARNYPEAEAFCRQVLAASPGNPDATILLADVAAVTGRQEVAKTLIRGVLQRHADHAEALVRQARFLRNDDEPILAVQLAQRAVELAPGLAEARVTYTQCLLDEWRANEAVETIQPLAEASPEVAAYQELLGVALVAAGRPVEAIGPLSRAYALDSNSSGITVNYAHALRLAKREEEAQAVIKAFIDAAWEVPPKLYNLGRALVSIGWLNEAEAALKRAVERDPAGDPPREAYGDLLQTAGRFDEAVNLYRQGIETRPLRVANYASLTTIQRVKDRDLIAPMVQLLQRKDLAVSDRQKLLYALGKAYEDLGEYEESIQRYREANSTALGRLPQNAFDHELHRQYVDTLINVVTPERVASAPKTGNPSELPVLVIGMIRSGTTLTDQILSAHPQVGSAGELNFLYDHALQTLSLTDGPEPAKLSDLAERYLFGLRQYDPDKPRVTDKMPKNALVAGLAHLAMPNARFIHCKRHPLDVCLSIYLTQYHRPLNYAHSIKNIAFYYRQHERIMAHWRAVLPSSRLFEVDYEALVTDREPVVKQMLDFLGLPWDKAVLKHDKNRGTIRTPSRWQARQPIYTSSVGRWKRFEPWIGDLLKEFPELTT